LYWPYLLTSLGLAVPAFLFFRKELADKLGAGIAGLVRYVAPRRAYLHPSAIVDYQIFLASGLFRGLLSWIRAVASISLVSYYVTQWLDDAFGSPRLELGEWNVIFFTVVYALAADFATFANHAIHHKVPLLWPIHSVHHSAEVLNPLTLYRKHPLYDMIKIVIEAPIVGIVRALVLFVFLGAPSIYLILGINAVYAVYRIVGVNLRHTHIWISYGPILNYVFISPAHHQIHHSARPEHKDKNLGGIFAVWDYLFGTLVIPNEEIRRNLVLGIGMDEPQRHPSLWKAYVEPLQRIGQMLRTAFVRTAG
jgi:sterol desaturase/sphingolipid hydroxylase (fatty acid hydroxylase superfamily)